MTERKLTPKQEAFCRAYIETSNASEAYRRAYNSENMQQDTIWAKACLLLKKDKVRARVDELTEQAAEKCAVTVETIAEELAFDRMAAHAVGQIGAAVSATMGRAKLFGLITDKREHTGKDGAALVPMVNVTIAGPAGPEPARETGNGASEPSD